MSAKLERGEPILLEADSGLDALSACIAAGCDVVLTDDCVTAGMARLHRREDDCAIGLRSRPEGAGHVAAFLEHLGQEGGRSSIADIAILETTGASPNPHHLAAVARVREFGLPVWASIGAAALREKVDADRLQQLCELVASVENAGAEAIILREAPRNSATEIASELIRATGLPIGVMLRSEVAVDTVGSRERTDALPSPEHEALEWIEAGAQIIGGDGGRPEEIAALRSLIDAAPAWSSRGG